MTEAFTFGGDIVWRPTPAYTERAHLTRFMARHNLPDYAALMARSTADIAWFTDAVLKYLDLRWARPYTRVVDLNRGPQWPRWCVDGRLNIVQSCIDKHYADSRRANQPAVRWENEAGAAGVLTYADLYREVNHCANALRQLGFKKGDAIGLFLPMTPEIVIALLAIVKIGAVVLPLFSGYGAGAIAARLNDAEAAGLITADGFFRRGQLAPMKSTADEAVAQTPSIREVLVLRYAGNAVEMKGGRDHWWHALVPPQSGFAEAEVMDAEDPFMIIYTSGTTGRPKGAVHTHCGFPVKAAQDMAFSTDVHGPEGGAPPDTIFWLTDMGWMMGPWLVFGSLILGATMLVYDGAPDFPGPDRLWALAARHGVTHLGLSPTLVRALLRYGEAPVRRHDLSALRFFASTGEPWNPDPWLWLFNVVGQGRRPIINYTGGTEIAGGILTGNPLLPLKPCAFSTACPGMDADVVDDEGRPIRNRVGELVIRQPWIGMTRGFWKDPARYEETYWSRWPGLWVHGDYTAIDADGQWYILGRSDDTLKIAGKRLGPAEVESVLVSHPAVVEAAAIGVPDAVKGNELVCFCVLSPGQAPTPELAQALQAQVAAALGKPLQPREIRFVKDLPKTRNAKVMRRLIRAAYLGQPLGDTSALENPGAVDEIRPAQ